MSVFVLRTQFSLGEELKSGRPGFSLMTCRFPWAPEVWLCGCRARCPIRPWWCCSPVLCVSPRRGSPVRARLQVAQVAQGLLLISTWLHPRMGLLGWV